jgi:hypothetical protein
MQPPPDFLKWIHGKVLYTAERCKYPNRHSDDSSTCRLGDREAWLLR